MRGDWEMESVLNRRDDDDSDDDVSWTSGKNDGFQRNGTSR